MKTKLLFLFLCIPQLSFAYYVSRPCCSWYQPCGWWGSGDYIFFWRKHSFYPPLVTTNPTFDPTLTNPGTTILFGNERRGPPPKAGARIDLGMWLTRCLGFGGGGFVLGEGEVEYSLQGDSAGNPIFGQPFTNVAAGFVQDANLLSSPTLQINGGIDIKNTNQLSGFDLYARFGFLSSRCFRFDLLGGYIYNQLTDNLEINTQTTTVAFPTTINVTDQFKAENRYSAGLVGLIAEWRSCNWLFSVTGKVGIGNMRKEVKISGTTTATSLGVTTVTNSGFLAQPSNIGSHLNTKFETASQVTAKLHLRVYSHIWATLGYSYMFWPAVDLASEQIDVNINNTQSPGPTIGTPSPVFHENRTSYWVQGVSGGLYIRY